MSKHITWMTGALVVMTLIGGVGAETAAAHRPAEVAVTVEASEYSFKPARIQVPKGAKVTIRLVNRGKEKHEWEIEALGRELGPIAPGASAEMSFVAEKPGTYPIVCDLKDHESRGMKGTLVIE